MSKSELYNKIVEIYKKTGQGLPYFVAERLNAQDEVESLISDGLIKKIKHTYRTLPDDNWLCLTKGYCVEEDSLENGQINTSPYSCIRFYLGQEMIVELGQIANMSLYDCIKNAEFISEYAKWLKKNEAKLKEMDEIEPMDLVEDKLPENALSYLKERKWYKENLTIDKCLKSMSERDELDEKQLGLQKQLVDLMKKSASYKNRLPGEELKLSEFKSEIKLRQTIKKFLLKKNQKSKIQDEF